MPSIKALDELFYGKSDKPKAVSPPVVAPVVAPKKLQQDQIQQDQIQQLPIDKLIPFPNQPFKPYTGDKLQELASSIGSNGIINPIIVRPLGDNYQIISGHNRVNAAKIVGLSTIPSILRYYSDTEAEIVLVEDNLMQRKEILPSEKAFAYKLKYDAMKRQGERKDLTLGHGVPMLRTSEMMAENLPDSEKQIRRYINLTRLIPELLEILDGEKIYFMACVNLSYISPESQRVIYEYFFVNNNLSISVDLSENLKELAKDEELTIERIENLLKPKSEKPTHLAAIKIKFKKIKQFFPKATTVEEVEEIIIKALEEYMKKDGKQ